MAIPTHYQSASFKGATIYNAGAQNYIVETLTGVCYMIFVNGENSDPSFAKSLDGGMTWGTATALKACTGTQIAVWYDRWSGINGDLIHVVYTDSGSDDTFYRNIDAANSDALSTEYTVFAGTDTAAGAALSIARMRGGNLVVVGTIDSGSEIFSKKSTDVGANWSNIAAGYEESGDLCIVMPGWGADNQDAMMFYYDRSATEISVKYYDDSADSWSEASIATSISLPNHASTSLGHMNAAVDSANSQNLLVFWTAVDSANADLRCFKVTQSTQTETTTNVVLNSTDDQGFCAISVYGSKWYVVYAGLSDGSETYNTSVKIYYKTSSDGGTTWSAETPTVDYWEYLTIMISKPIIYKYFGVIVYATIAYEYIAELNIPRTTYQLGI